MRKVLGILILISAIVYGEGLPQLKATVSEKNDRIEIKIKKREKVKIQNVIPKVENRIIRHKVKKGETLSGIARKYSVSIFQINKENMKIQDIVNKLQKNNKQIKNIDLIYTGDTLIISK